MTKYYLDACIWRDYFENRSDRFRPLGEWAFLLIKKIIREEGVFVLSDHLISELRTHFSVNDLKNIFDMIPRKLILKIESTKKQAKDASFLRKSLKVPFDDALHAVLARDSKAIMVTRDNHFIDLSEIVAINKPEELI